MPAAAACGEPISESSVCLWFGFSRPVYDVEGPVDAVYRDLGAESGRTVDGLGASNNHAVSQGYCLPKLLAQRMPMLGERSSGRAQER